MAISVPVKNTTEGYFNGSSSIHQHQFEHLRHDRPQQGFLGQSYGTDKQCFSSTRRRWRRDGSDCLRSGTGSDGNNAASIRPTGKGQRWIIHIHGRDQQWPNHLELLAARQMMTKADKDFQAGTQHRYDNPPELEVYTEDEAEEETEPKKTGKPRYPRLDLSTPSGCEASLVKVATAVFTGKSTPARGDCVSRIVRTLVDLQMAISIEKRIDSIENRMSELKIPIDPSAGVSDEWLEDRRETMHAVDAWEEANPERARADRAFDRWADLHPELMEELLTFVRDEERQEIESEAIRKRNAAEINRDIETVTDIDNGRDREIAVGLFNG